MFSQRNNPYCVYPSKKDDAKVLKIIESHKFLAKKFCFFKKKTEILQPKMML